MIDKSNIAIVGLTTKDGGKTVTIKCSSHSGPLFLSSTNITLVSLVLHSNIHINTIKGFQMYTTIFSGVQLVDVVIDSGSNARLTHDQYTYEYGNKFNMGSNKVLECPYYLDIEMVDDRNIAISGEPFYIFAKVHDCNDTYELTYDWRYDLNVCVISGPASFYSFYFSSYKQCDTIVYQCDSYNLGSFPIILFYNSKSDNMTNSNKIRLSFRTQGLMNQNLQHNLSVNLLGCTDSRTGKCDPGYGVPINQLDRCVQCDQHPSIPGWVMFILIQLLPVTVVVFILIVFNMQLTNGFMIGVVFYCQMISVVYPNLSLNVVFDINYFNYYDCSFNNVKWYIIPCNIFNLDFLSFLFLKPLCITSNMTPLQAILFWYIIPTYPLVLLLLIYTWITMYDKGFRCVVTITIPLHRLLARFWRKTKIEPSLIHSIASIYLLCFTQFATTSLQLLYPTTWYVWNSTYALFDDGVVKHFSLLHCLAGIFAIIVLVFIIFLPMLYIQLYPFKLFHKLLSCLHLRKEILISLGDIFTGPFKNGSDNTRDYRFFAGFYFVLRIIILCFYLIPYELSGESIASYCQISLFALFSGMIMIFRPYKNNLQNFSNLIFFLFLMAASAIPLIGNNPLTIDSQPTVVSQILIVTFSGILFLGIISVVVWRVKKIDSTCVYCRGSNNPSRTEEHAGIQPLFEIDDNWIADRMEHPDNYDEQHVQYELYDLSASQPQDITVHATYGSTINRIKKTDNSETNQLSLGRDTRSTAGSKRSTIHST